MLNITFIASFKEFTGSDRIAQRSALYSWSQQKIPVITASNEPSIESNCNDYHSITLLPDVKTGRDIPQKFKNNCLVLNDFLVKSLKKTQTSMIALINGDIIILPDFLEVFEKMIEKYGENTFYTGTRFDINLENEIKDNDSYKEALSLYRKKYNTINSSDIFIGSKKMFEKMAKDMPSLIVGRYGWDNWIHYWAEANMDSKLNFTDTLITLHVVHDHGHISSQEGRPGRNAPSSIHNITLLRNMQDKYGPNVRIGNWPKVEL